MMELPLTEGGGGAPPRGTGLRVNGEISSFWRIKSEMPVRHPRKYLTR